MQYRRHRSVTIVLLIALLLFALAGTVAAQDVIPAEEGELVGEGFNGPQGVLLDAGGNVWVIGSGLGGEEEIPWFTTEGEPTTAQFGETAGVYRISAEDGSVESVATLPSLAAGQDVVGGARLVQMDGQIYATTGWGIGTPETEVPDGFVGVTRIHDDGSSELIADLWDFEVANNPDPAIFDTHPYGLNVGPDGMLYVADAGANDLLQVDPETGDVSLVTVFDPIPGVFPRPDRGGEMLTDPVATDVVFDDEGNAYVSYLSGAPFVPGSAKVVTVDVETGEVSDFATGLTMVMDLAWGPDGELYAVQFSASGEQGPTPGSGSVVHVMEGDASAPVIGGLTFPTSLDIDDEGTVYVTVGGVGPPGSGAVLAFSGAASAGETMAPADSAPRGIGNPIFWIINLLVPFLN